MRSWASSANETSRPRAAAVRLNRENSEKETVMRRHPFALPLAGALLLASTHAAAEACTFIPTPRQVLVGNTASDGACNFSDIGSAIADAALHPTCTTTIHVMRSLNYEHLSV